MQEKLSEVQLCIKVIEDAVVLNKSKLDSHQIEIKIDLPVDFKIRSKSSDLLQIFNNLITNSVDALESEEQKWIRISLGDSHGTCRILVADSGQGIDPKIQDKVMLPFFTTKDPGKGIGVGLTLARNLAQALGAQLYLDNQAQKTTFVLEFPAESVVGGWQIQSKNHGLKSS